MSRFLHGHFHSYKSHLIHKPLLSLKALAQIFTLNDISLVWHNRGILNILLIWITKFKSNIIFKAILMCINTLYKQMKYESGKDLMWNKLWAILSLYVVALLLEIFTVICNQSYFVSNFLSDQIAFFMAIILKNTVFGYCFFLSVQIPMNAVYKVPMLYNYIRYNS